MAPLPAFTRPPSLDTKLAEPEPFTHDFVDVGNGYESLTKLFDLPRGSPTRIYEGELQFSDAAVRYRAQKQAAPPAANAVGIKVGVDGSRYFGPNSAFHLGNLWVKELADNGGAKVAFIGTVW